MSARVWLPEHDKRAVVRLANAVEREGRWAARDLDLVGDLVQVQPPPAYVSDMADLARRLCATAFRDAAQRVQQ